MSDTTNTIECPQCHHKIDISDVLYQQVERDLRQGMQDELDRERAKIRSGAAEIEAQQVTLEHARAAQDEIVRKAVTEQLRAQQKAMKEVIEQRIREEQSEQIKDLRAELDSKSEQVKQLYKATAEIQRLKREKEEAESKAELEAERKMNILLVEEKVKIARAEEEKSTMKIMEKELLIKQLTDRVKDMQRKAEQGSMQTQGEAQELVLEEWLGNTYPLDTIEEIGKGKKGGDCVQIINTRSAENCGQIYYESKRTKAFGPDWIEKFKVDIQNRGADIGVLVTQAMPADLPQMGQKEGIWICTFEELKTLSSILRESLISIHAIVSQQEHKGDKMSVLYRFLTSTEFTMQVEAIVEGFTQMQSDMEKEKRAMQAIWKQREKQIDKVLLNTTNMYGSIKGIAGNAIPVVKYLELAEGSIETDNDDLS